VKITIDTDQLLKRGYAWVRRNVPLTPTAWTVAFAMGARYLWAATYLPTTPGQFERNVMVAFATFAAGAFSAISWTEYSDRRRKAREP